MKLYEKLVNRLYVNLSLLNDEDFECAEEEK